MAIFEEDQSVAVWLDHGCILFATACILAILNTLILEGNGIVAGHKGLLVAFWPLLSHSDLGTSVRAVGVDYLVIGVGQC